MEISFDTKSLREVCEDNITARLELGDRVAEQLIRRIADIRAATSTSDLLVGRPKRLETKTGELFSLELAEEQFLFFAPNHNTVPLLETGKVNWLQVSRVKIIDIGLAYAQD